MDKEHIIDDVTNISNQKRSVKNVKFQLVKVSIEEINSVRPSVYKYLLP